MASALSAAYPIKLISLIASPRWSLAIALALVAAGCSEPVPVASSADVVDSAGIQVVTSKAPAWGDKPQWKVSSSPSLTIGGVAGDPALDFVGIVGARRLGDGTLVVANGGTGELRWFSADGTPVRTVGGRGKAGAPFGSIVSLYSLGDTLLVWDPRVRVLTLVSSSGAVLRQDTLRMADSTRRFAILGAFGDGKLLAEAGVPLELKDREPGLVRPGRSLFLLDRGVPDSIDVLPGEELRLSITDGRPVLTAVPFGLGSRLTVLADGYLTSEGDRNELAEHDERGRVRRIIRWPGARLPVTQDDIDRQGRALLGSAGTGAQRAQLDSIWRDMRKPDSLPAIIGMMADPRALAWVRRGMHVADSETEWWVIAKDGTWLGSLMLPGTAAPLDITGEWIVLRTVDANRIERVEVRRIRR
jgi:hypothetical protein